MIEVGADLDSTSGCCGVKQITDFSDPDHHGYDVTAEAKTLKTAYKRLFTKIRKELKGGDWSCAVAQIWFVKQTMWDGTYKPEYEAEPLRLLIETIPGVVHLGEYHNPNSGNMIKGYQWAVK